MRVYSLSNINDVVQKCYLWTNFGSLSQGAFFESKLQSRPVHCTNISEV